jgi:phosphocarrier protein HPr
LRKKIERSVKVKNKLGLHVRPASSIVKLLQDSRSRVTLTYKGESVNAHSIMSIMMLAAPKNACLKISAEGDDADETVEKLEKAFEKEFGEG